MVNVDRAQTGLSGPDNGTSWVSWAALSWTRVTRSGLPHGASALLLGSSPQAQLTVDSGTWIHGPQARLMVHRVHLYLLLSLAHGAPGAPSSLGVVAPSSLYLMVALLAGGEPSYSPATVARQGC